MKTVYKVVQCKNGEYVSLYFDIDAVAYKLNEVTKPHDFEDSTCGRLFAFTDVHKALLYADYSRSSYYCYGHVAVLKCETTECFDTIYSNKILARRAKLLCISMDYEVGINAAYFGFNDDSSMVFVDDVKPIEIVKKFEVCNRV